MPLTFTQLAIDVIRAENRAMAPNEIWEKAVELGLTEQLLSSGQTPIKTLGAQLYVSIKRDPDNSPFIQVSKRPALFSLRELTGTPSSIPITNGRSVHYSFNERHLHKILASFIFSDSHFNCYSKTIFHEVSSRGQRGENEWLHPDIVAVRYPFDDFNDDTRRLMSSIEHSDVKLFSFEMKIELSFANLRKSYFQAVSNSSWANEGYIVALKYDQNPDFIDELRRLNRAFGIGFIKLNADDYTQSEIILSARENELDWNTIDRLCDKNDDFKSFTQTVSFDLGCDRVRNINDFDDTFTSDEEFQDYVRQLNIH
ncbi:hypothetical protein SAMN02910265_01245 [Ruminococcus flavefaciens]|jgi:hypothetical protein|uniref:HTH HARE-type domain-containing protein n=1 Tax=Ruminococcus flavefaciens TaxID=1265 RepID=A0A1H6IT32_RUMFL|nr:HTH domain-containing protein [Ruminococcus flavefaciens]SEH52444.1 hypothetical protein SAMN02910265_01245 [Ruminococcus flavefaciens]